MEGLVQSTPYSSKYILYLKDYTIFQTLMCVSSQNQIWEMRYIFEHKVKFSVYISAVNITSVSSLHINQAL